MKDYPPFEVNSKQLYAVAGLAGGARPGKFRMKVPDDNGKIECALQPYAADEKRDSGNGWRYYEVDGEGRPKLVQK